MDQATDIEQNFPVQSIRIDKHEFEPKKQVAVSSQGIRIYVPDKHRPNENIVVDILKQDVTKISCYLCGVRCVLLLSITGKCIESIQKCLETDDADDSLNLFEKNNQITLQLDGMVSEALKALRSIFASKIISLDETEYIDAMDEFHERSDPVILVYPPPHIAQRGIQINREDYKCLSVENPINDVIVDFYLKYLHEEMLTEVERERTYIFSQFFYNRLNASQHAQVARWTRNVNLFDKDFIIVPINIERQWLLAVICFPNFSSTENVTEKSSCILFFDSLVNNSWDDVATTLRTYLTNEYLAKLGSAHEFTRENMPDYEVEVPQQDNVYDSGLYVLQYAESFFKHPIKDFRSASILNEQLCNWFDNNDIQMKRKKISFLITELVQQYNPKKMPLPHINTECLKEAQTTALSSTVDLTISVDDEEDEDCDEEDFDDEEEKCDEDEDNEEIEDEQLIVTISSGDEDEDVEQIGEMDIEIDPDEDEM